MGTELAVIIGHRLEYPPPKSLPAMLNDYFSAYDDEEALRLPYHCPGLLHINEGDNGELHCVWEPLSYAEPLEEPPVRRWRDEPIWKWGCERRKDFEAWFRRESESGLLCLAGAFGFNLYVHPSATWLATFINWDDFLFNSNVQNDERTYVGVLAKFFGKSRAIYLPDDTILGSESWRLIRDGRSVDEIEIWLREQEPPAPTKTDMIRFKRICGVVHCWEANGYFVEDFTVDRMA
jgi:hypothetical protein